MLAEQGYPPVETVANTIFPAAMALQTPEPAGLGQRYRECYGRIRRFQGNEKGTYFGRMVDYPHPKHGSVDQLADLVRKLQVELGLSGPVSARYEMAPSLPGPDAPVQEDQGGEPEVDTDDGSTADVITGSETTVDGTVRIVAPGTDTARIGFPCLSWCSFQLDGEHLHLVAHYRSQYLIRRGYGNYLALARLQRYVAEATGLHTGELMIVAGYAQVDVTSARPVQQMLRETPPAV